MLYGILVNTISYHYISLCVILHTLLLSPLLLILTLSSSTITNSCTFHFYFWIHLHVILHHINPSLSIKTINPHQSLFHLSSISIRNDINSQPDEDNSSAHKKRRKSKGDFNTLVICHSNQDARVGNTEGEVPYSNFPSDSNNELRAKV